MNTLITFLGRVPKGENGYRTTSYDFGDGSQYDPTAFFGWTLLERDRPDRLVVLGTAGSMWDHLFESDFDFGAEAEEERLALTEGVEKQTVTADLLDSLAPMLGRRLGIEVRLELIPFCRTADEQVKLLRVLADHVGNGAEVDLDVTHGYRHLPMLGLLSALHLRRVRDAQIRHIWYGAYDPDTEKAPVHDLNGLLEIADWLEALAVYDHTGDYGVFGTLLGKEIGGELEDAAFLETVNRIGQARSRVRSVLKKIEGEALPGGPAAALFRPELERRLAWAEVEHFYARQRQLCLEYLDRGRYQKAVLVGWEAFTTRLLQEHGGLNPLNHDHRKQVCEKFEERERNMKPRSTKWLHYDNLRRLRNAIAHGSEPKGDEVQSALSGAQAMRSFLHPLLEHLLPEP